MSGFVVSYHPGLAPLFPCPLVVALLRRAGPRRHPVPSGSFPLVDPVFRNLSGGRANGRRKMVRGGLSRYTFVQLLLMRLLHLQQRPISQGERHRGRGHVSSFW